MDSSPLAIGKEVIEREAQALQSLYEALDESFEHAISLIAAVTGRVVITGMGKSGHIANKIAATFSSTGTPAFFVHPGEASHGDLGMISSQDLIIALSNSGETKELSDIIFFSKRYGMPLIGVTQKKESTLSELADVTLLLPSIPEACPNGLAPTTSSTMMLALGDALAVALLHRKAFSKEDFKALHPGGQLGNRLKRVSDIMHREPQIPIVNISALMKEALLVMTHKSFGCVGVIDNDKKLVGIITDGDLRRHMSSNLLKETVANVMTKKPKTIGLTALVEEALHKMSGTITSLFVVDDQQKPVGIIHIHDLLRLNLV